MKSNVDMWDCDKYATLEVIDGKSVIISTRTSKGAGGIYSKPLTMDFSKHVFLEMNISEVSTKWGVVIYVSDKNEEETKVDVLAASTVKGAQRLNLSYAMMNNYPDWQGKRKFRIHFYVSGEADDKVTLDYMKIEQTDEEALDISDSPIHFRPAGKATFGDPNPFFWNGEYHVFHMLGRVGHSPWDHIVSKDLLNWKKLPIAIEAGKEGEPDENSCGSGSVMEHNGTFYIFYTGFNGGYRAHPNGRQQVMIATSPDLITWTKRPEWTFGGDGEYYYNVAKNGHLPPEHGGENGDQCFRDPYVWYNEEAGEYWMAVVARDVKDDFRTCIGRYVSDDLIHWEPRSPLKHTHGMDCPDVFQIGDRWYRLGYCAQYDSSASGPLGPYDMPENGYLQFDTEFIGTPKRMWDGKRHIIVGRVRDTIGYCDSGQRDWGGSMSMPREVYADENGLLMSRPVPEIIAVFSKTALDLAQQPDFKQERPDWEYKDGKLVGGSRIDHPWRSSKCSFDVPPDYMLQCSFSLGNRTTMTISMRQQDGDEGSGYHVILRPMYNEVEFGSAYYRFKCEMPMSWDKPITLQAFVYRSIIECFVNDGHVFTIRAYDYPKGKLSLSVDNGSVNVEELVVKVAE